MTYGLDIGSGTITGVTDDGDEPTGSEPAVAFAVAESALESAGLSPADASTVDVDGATYVVGTGASTVAAAVGSDPDDLFRNGSLVDEAYARPALEAIVETVLPERADEPGCYATPGTVVDATATTEPHRDVAESIRAVRGDEPAPIARGFAVVYDQLAADNYTGLGVCIGRQTTSVALAYYGVPAMAFSVAKGGEWLVERAAADAGCETARVAAVLEEFELDPNAAAGAVESALARAYDALVGEIADAIGVEADENELREGLAVPIAIGGERAVEGVEYLFGGRLDASNLPFSVRGVRLADEPAASPARGALAAARDGVADADGITVAESTVGGDGSSVADEARGADVGSEGITLSFDESLDPERETERADDAVERLFDRLANRDEEIRSVTAELEALRTDLEAVAERAATASDLDSLDDRVDELGDDLRGELERATADAADADAVAELRETVAAVRESADALEGSADELNATTDELTTGLETLESRLEDVEDDVAERVGALDERTSEHATRLDDLEAAADESAADRVPDPREEIDALRAELGSVRTASSAPVGVAPVVAAGGGGAGLVAGGTVALAGSVTVGAAAVVVGVLLLVAAVSLGG